MRLAPLALLAALVMLAAAVPRVGARVGRLFAPAGAGLTLELPAGWRETTPDKGWRFEAVAPRSGGWVFLSVVRAVVANRSFQRALVAFERRETRRLGPHVTFRTSRATLDGEDAVEITAAAPGGTSEWIYGFQHGGREYMLVFAAPAGRGPALEPVVAGALRTLRFAAAP